MIVSKEEMELIIKLADALARGHGEVIQEINIMHENGSYTGAFAIKGKYMDTFFEIRAERILHKEKPEFIKDLDIEEDFEAKRKKAIDKFLRKDEEARMKISEELSTQTAAEAMEGMKNAVDNLEIKKKPKRSESGWSGARPKDRHEKILKLYNEGWTKVKMAEELGIGISTVNYHIQKLRDEGKI